MGDYPHFRLAQLIQLNRIISGGNRMNIHSLAKFTVKVTQVSGTFCRYYKH
jgi:hypothetical protein